MKPARVRIAAFFLRYSRLCFCLSGTLIGHTPVRLQLVNKTIRRPTSPTEDREGNPSRNIEGLSSQDRLSDKQHQQQTGENSLKFLVHKMPLSDSTNHALTR